MTVKALKTLIDHMSLVSSVIADIYKLIVKKYIMMLLAQLRRDFKSYLNYDKTMAHRKQIKTTKKSTANERTGSSETGMRQKRKKRQPNRSWLFRNLQQMKLNPKEERGKLNQHFWIHLQKPRQMKLNPKEE